MFKLNLLTPEKKVIVDLEVVEVSIPTSSGEVNILKGHVPLIANLGTGVLKFKSASDQKVFKSVVSSGYCEVSPEGVNVLTEYVQLKEEMNEENIKAQKTSAETKLGTQMLSDDEFNHTVTEIDRQSAALEILK